MKNIRIRKLVISSGKGGVGKSMLSSTLAMLFAKEQKIIAVDCDVDAPNLALWLGGDVRLRLGGQRDKIFPVVTSAKPKIDLNKCDGCGLCVKNCRFYALKMIKSRPVLNPFVCEGCGVCELVCPKGAIKLKPVQNGEIRVKQTRYGFPLISGQLFPGETGSGKIVEEIKSRASFVAQNMIKAGEILMIIDSSPGTGCPVIAALKDADFCLLITEPSPSGFTDLKRVLEVVGHFKIPYGIVINKWDINPDLSNKMESWAEHRFMGKISYDEKIFKAISNLVPILETKLKAGKEIKDVYNKLRIILDFKKTR